MEQDELLRLVADAMLKHGIVYGFTGSQASSLYGENRFTLDIDVVAEIRSPAVLAAFLGEFDPSDFYVSDIGARHAIANGGQFNIIHQDSSQKVDVIIRPNSDWPDELVRRVQMPLADGRPAWFVAAEDLILHKMAFYREGGSDKHLRDVASMLKISGDQIDRGYVTAWSARLGLSDIWSAVLDRVDAQRRDDEPPF